MDVAWTHPLRPKLHLRFYERQGHNTMNVRYIVGIILLAILIYLVVVYF